jgi:hypothetical protein
MFTPGPWILLNVDKIEDGSDFTVIRNDLGKEVLGTSEWLRAEVNDLILMARAPEMLRALELIYSLEMHPQQVKSLLDKINKGFQPVSKENK